MSDQMLDDLLREEEHEERAARRAARLKAIRESERPQTTPVGPVTQPTAVRSDRSWIVATFAILIGLPFWLEGARYTRDGWINFINWLMVRFAIPAQVPPLSWQVALGLMIGIGLAYSYIEMGRQPFAAPPRRELFFKPSAWRVSRSWQAWLIWIVLIASDIGTTFSGVRQPRPEELVVLQSIGQRIELAIIYGIIITFIPDRLVRYGLRGLWGKPG